MAGFKGYKKSIYLDFNYDEVKKGVPQVNKQMALLNAEFKKQMEQANQTGNSLDKLGIKQEMLANKAKLQADKISELKKELEKLSNAEKKNEKAIAEKTIELKNAETQLLKVQKKLEDVNKEVNQQNTKLGKAANAISDYAEKSKQAGVDLNKLAGTMQKVGMVLTGIGVAATKMSSDFDKEMAKARTIADTTEISFEDLREGTLKISGDMNLAATDMAEGLYNIISSNIDTADSLKVLNSAALLAKTGFTDTTTAVDILTTIINSYKISVDDATKITDQLIITQKLGKLTVGDLGDSFGKIAGLAATAKIPIEELLAAIATLTTNGIQTSEAVTGLKGIISAVIKPTGEAAEEAKRLGLQFNLTALQSKGLSGFLEDVQNKTRGNSESMAKLFGRVEGLNSMFILTGSGAKMFAEDIDKIKNSSGAAEKALKDLQTPGERFDKALNKIKNSLIDTGGALSPILNLISSFLELVAKIPPGVIATIAVLGMVALVIGTVAKTILATAETIKGLKLLTAGMDATALKWVGIIMAVAAALAVVLGLIAALTNKASDVEKVFNSATGTTQKYTQEIQNQTNKMPNYAVHGSHKSGLDYVPFDGYRAELHKGERVQRADENPYNPNANNADSGGGDQYITVNVKADDLQQMADVVRLFERFRQTKRAGVVI